MNPRTPCAVWRLHVHVIQAFTQLPTIIEGRSQSGQVLTQNSEWSYYACLRYSNGFRVVATSSQYYYPFTNRRARDKFRARADFNGVASLPMKGRRS